MCGRIARRDGLASQAGGDVVEGRDHPPVGVVAALELTASVTDRMKALRCRTHRGNVGSHLL